jgi:hypothetical protein
MPVTHQIIGTGITKRINTKISFDGPCSEEEYAAFGRMVEAYNSNTWENYLAHWEDFCQNLLTKAQLPPWGKAVHVDTDGNWTEVTSEDEIKGRRSGSITTTGLLVEAKHGIDSELWFACEILAAIDRVQRAIADHDPAKVASAGVALGGITSLAVFKFTWEPDIAFSKKTRQKRREANAASIETRRGLKQKALDTVRSRAIDLWRNDPIGITKTAKIIAQELNLNIHTVRGYLKNAEEWSPFQTSKTKKIRSHLMSNM